MTSPNGCKYCGYLPEHHGRRVSNGIGMHVWTEPTDEERKARLIARRATIMSNEVEKLRDEIDRLNAYIQFMSNNRSDMLTHLSRTQDEVRDTEQKYDNIIRKTRNAVLDMDGKTAVSTLEYALKQSGYRHLPVWVAEGSGKFDPWTHGL